MTRITFTIDADLGERVNTYEPGSEAKNIAEAVTAGHMQPGVVTFVELSTGDVVRGSLVSVSVAKAEGEA